MTRPDMTGVMLTPRPGDAKRYEFYGFVQIAGAAYKFTAWRNPYLPTPTWSLQLKPHTGSDETSGEAP